MVKFSDSYVFESPDGPKTLAKLFEGREQLVVYYQFRASAAKRLDRRRTGGQTA